MNKDSSALPRQNDSRPTLLLQQKAPSQNAELGAAHAGPQHDLVAEVTIHGQILVISPAVKGLLGYDPSELLLTSVFQHVHPEDRTRIRAQFASRDDSIAGRFRHKDGSWRWLETSGRDFSAPGGPTCAVLVLRELSASRQSAAYNALTDGPGGSQGAALSPGTLAHDFNNLLAVILAYTELAELEADDPVEFRRHLAEIRVAARTARDLVPRLI